MSGQAGVKSVSISPPDLRFLFALEPHRLSLLSSYTLESRVTASHSPDWAGPSALGVLLLSFLTLRPIHCDIVIGGGL